MTFAASRPFRLGTALADAASLLAAVLIVPFAILAIGAPFALAGAALLWLARIARAAL